MFVNALFLLGRKLLGQKISRVLLNVHRVVVVAAYLRAPPVFQSLVLLGAALPVKLVQIAPADVSVISKRS